MPRATLRTLLIFIAIVTGASSQTLAPKRLSKEPLEKYENPPPLAPAVGTSPGLISRFGPYTSYQVNVNANGNNVVGDAANEPSICVVPTDTNKMSIGWRQFDSISSNFRQAGFAHTINGGGTWISAGDLQRNVFRSDPVLNSDNAGRFFYLSLLQNFFDDLWRSLDAANHGRLSRRRMAATSSGLRSTTPTARAVDFNTNPGAATATITPVDNSLDRPMAV